MNHVPRIERVMIYAALPVALTCCFGAVRNTTEGQPWPRHTIDDSSQGADGVRLLDVNGDGRLDVSTPWEEGGVIRVYLQPAASAIREQWPAVTVGQVASPEDAVFVDLDADGAVDVVSSCEGKQRSVFVHWAPKDAADYLDPAAWRTEPLAATVDNQMWMFALPLDVDGKNGIDLIVGGKGPGASVAWLESPADPRQANQWRLHPLRPAGWIMSLLGKDVDGDGDLDVVFSDRKKKNRGIWWMENPGKEAAAGGASWTTHGMGGDVAEPMFLDVADLNQDGLEDVVCTSRGGELFFLERLSTASEPKWKWHRFGNPLGLPWGKSVRVADVDLDGRIDLVHAGNTQGNRQHRGVVWMSCTGNPADGDWTVHDISGPEGVKFDLLQTIDLDGDGDLDVIGCEERDNLGVFWYENPTR